MRRITLVLDPVDRDDGVSPEIRLRSLLKTAWRHYRFRCVSISETPDPAAPPAKPAPAAVKKPPRRPIRPG